MAVNTKESDPRLNRRLGWRILVVLCCASATASEPTAPERGRRLFNGELPLVARVTGHASPLPPYATRCVNCHTTRSPGPTASTGSPTRSFGPVITAAMLNQKLARRGGPPSHYDEAAFCRLLAAGVDPAHVIIPRNMPRYDVSAADCHALWTYLSQARR